MRFRQKSHRDRSPDSYSLYDITIYTGQSGNLSDRDTGCFHLNDHLIEALDIQETMD